MRSTLNQETLKEYEAAANIDMDSRLNKKSFDQVFSRQRSTFCVENSFKYILQRQNGVWGAEGRGLFFPEYFAKHTILKKYVEYFFHS